MAKRKTDDEILAELEALCAELEALDKAGLLQARWGAILKGLAKVQMDIYDVYDGEGSRQPKSIRVAYWSAHRLIMERRPAGASVSQKQEAFDAFDLEFPFVEGDYAETVRLRGEWLERRWKKARELGDETAGESAASDASDATRRPSLVSASAAAVGKCQNCGDVLQEGVATCASCGAAIPMGLRQPSLAHPVVVAAPPRPIHEQAVRDLIEEARRMISTDARLFSMFMGCRVERGGASFAGTSYTISSTGPLGGLNTTVFRDLTYTTNSTPAQSYALAFILSVNKKGVLGSRPVNTPVERHVDVLRALGFQLMVLPDKRAYEILPGIPGIRRIPLAFQLYAQGDNR